MMSTFLFVCNLQQLRCIHRDPGTRLVCARAPPCFLTGSEEACLLIECRHVRASLCVTGTESLIVVVLGDLLLTFVFCLTSSECYQCSGQPTIVCEQVLDELFFGEHCVSPCLLL